MGHWEAWSGFQTGPRLERKLDPHSVLFFILVFVNKSPWNLSSVRLMKKDKK